MRGKVIPPLLTKTLCPIESPAAFSRQDAKLTQVRITPELKLLSKKNLSKELF